MPRARLRVFRLTVAQWFHGKHLNMMAEFKQQETRSTIQMLRVVLSREREEFYNVHPE